MTLRYLDLADLLIIAEAVLETPAEKLAYSSRLTLAESAAHAPAASYDGIDFYPDLPTKAAVLCIHLAKNHPFPDGNKRVAFLAMIEFMERNGHHWTPPPGDEDGEVSAQIILDIGRRSGDRRRHRRSRSLDQRARRYQGMRTDRQVTQPSIFSNSLMSTTDTS